MLNKPQDQNAGEGAVAIQAAGSADNVTVNQTNNTQHNYGITVEEVHAVAKDSFRADFVQLLGQAGDIAEARANRVVERFLDRLQTDNPTGLSQANTPDFRYALFSVQKAQARSGDANLEELLVELLIERSREEQRNLQQIVLNEALEVAARLTQAQVEALTVIFLLRRTVGLALLDFNAWLTRMDLYVQPYINNARLSEASFSHLAFTGCGVVELAQVSFADLLRTAYPGIWQLGIAADDPTLKSLSADARRLLKHSSHTAGCLEVVGATEGFADQLRASVMNIDERTALKQLQFRQSLDDEKMKARCISARPYMENLFDLWDNTPAKSFMPSSVGIAIAHSNVRRRLPNFGSLSIWIN